MRVPPGLKAKDFADAVKEFQAAVGKEWVFTSDEDVDLYRDAYSPFWDEPEERIASAAVAPDTVEEVQKVVRIANQYKVPIYPISTGRNLGYGGSAPNYSGSVVLDLKRMNRILDVSESNASALVEPGVSYFDLYRYIQDRGIKLWVDVPDPGWGSPSAIPSITAAAIPARPIATTSIPIAAWRSCSPTASFCAPAWARCRTRRPGSNTKWASARGSTGSFRNRISAW